MGGHASNVYFGMNAMAISTVLLAATYAVIISEKVNRAIVALVGAGLMVMVGVLSQEEAIKGVDWNTIGLLTGMMILVSVSRKSFLRKLTGRGVAQIGPASLAAELYAALHGADAIRTHEPGAVRDALTIWGHIAGGLGGRSSGKP